MAAKKELLYFNGIDGDTGEYALPPMTAEDLSEVIQGVNPPENLSELKFRHDRSTVTTFGIKEGVDPLKLEEAGWGVIFPAKGDPAIEEALKELIDLRRGQAGDRFHIYDGPDGYRPDESKTDFLARHGAGPGPADPEIMPYYLLIVGGPAEIPYRFQTQLDVQYSVGRIHFDSPQEYANYAHSVATAESGQLKLPRRASFFGVSNPGDKATQLSADNLVEPLYKKFKDKDPEEENLKDWEFNAILRDQTIKTQLARLLGGDQTPALLFSASHGMSFSPDSPDQVNRQGALLCQDWPGPAAWQGKGAIPQDFYFSGEDLASDAGLLGLIAFFFACYGAGTPLIDEFSKQAFKQPTPIAKAPFLAQLPRKMLSHPRGGALAVVGHVERAWGYSFLWPGAGQQTTVFESTLQSLFQGKPVGAAVEYFNERYAELSTMLSDKLEDVEFGKKADPYELSGMWTANNDARGYTIIGDPAVHLPVAASGEQPLERPVIVMVGSQPETGKTPDTAEKLAASSGQGPESAAAASSSQPAQAEGGPPAAQAAGVRVTAGIHGETAAAASGSSFSATTVVEAAGVDFGLLDNLTDTRTRLTNAVQQFAENLGKALAKAVDDAATLQVSTYVIGDMSAIGTGNDIPAGAKLRAFTMIKIDGDTQVVVPEDAGEIDQALWSIHLDMVRQAQANRTEMMKAAASAATGLLQAFKVL
jgi:hypothetical protein